VADNANDTNDATADETNEAIGAGVSVKAIDSDNEDGLLDNQLAELEKLDAANEANVSNVVIEANKASLAEANELLATNSIAIVIKYLNKLLLDDCIVIFAHIC
jgi:hypothetical protein